MKVSSPLWIMALWRHRRRATTKCGGYAPAGFARLGPSGPACPPGVALISGIFPLQWNLSMESGLQCGRGEKDRVKWVGKRDSFGTFPENRAHSAVQVERFDVRREEWWILCGTFTGILTSSAVQVDRFAGERGKAGFFAKPFQKIGLSVRFGWGGLRKLAVDWRPLTVRRSPSSC